MKLLDETDALTEIRSLLERATAAKLAVAFWGKGAIERLGLNRDGLSAEILCNLDSGACNPAELRCIRAIPGVELKSHPSLHAKVYWTRNGAVLGSSNASANGLALEGDASGGWLEANVRLDEPMVLKQIETWFAERFLEGHDISEADLARAEQVWKARARMVPTGKRLVGNLLTAFTNAPTHPAWTQVKLTYCSDGLKDDDEAWLGAEQKNGRLDSGILAYGQWNHKIGLKDWILDFDVSLKKPRFNDLWRALPVEASRADLRLVSKVKHIRLGAFGRLTLTEADIASLCEITDKVLVAHSDDGGRNAVIDITTAMKLVTLARTTPSEKAFLKAMEQIYIDAVKIGYRPTGFRQMLANHGGVETARRLVRGKATSGFERLWEERRLDLSVEELILKPEWQPLFSTEEHEIARKRLRDYPYPTEG